MPSITQEQYFALNNEIITRSKIMDYELCPHYFYRKHITGEITRKTTSSAFAIGGAVDDLLAQIEMSRDIVVFHGDRRTKDGKAEYAELIDDGKIVVNETQYDQIIGISSAVEETSAYKELSDYDKQVVLMISTDTLFGMSSKHFKNIAGLPDFIKVDHKKKHVSIKDLKTAQTIEPRKYYWHCEKYGYFYQAALYTMLVRALYPGYTTDFGHIVAEKTEPFRVATFMISESVIEENILKVSEIIKQILSDEKFTKKDISWSDAVLLGENNIDWEESINTDDQEA